MGRFDVVARRARRLRGRRWRGLAREDLAQPLDVDLFGERLLSLSLQPRTSFGSEHVDLAVQEAPLVGEVVLLSLQVGDQAMQVVVGQRREIGKDVHATLSFDGSGVSPSKARWILKGQPLLEIGSSASASSTSA